MARNLAGRAGAADVRVYARRTTVYDPKLGGDREEWSATVTWRGGRQTRRTGGASGNSSTVQGALVSADTLHELFEQLARLVRTTEREILDDVGG